MAKARRRQRRMSLTSLIDVIFLLLLFFMLTSTFSRYAEVELSAASGTEANVNKNPPVFLRLSPDTLTVNGDEVSLQNIASSLEHDALAPRIVLVSISDGVTAQRLTDLLGAVRKVPGIALSVLGRS